MIRVMLIDDEEDALDLLEILLAQIDDVQVAGRYVNPIQAVEAFEIQSTDYLLKPFTLSRLQTAVKRIKPRVPAARAGSTRSIGRSAGGRDVSSVSASD